MSRSIYVLVALAVTSVGYHLYQLKQRDIFYVDREVYQVKKWCDGNDCSQEIDYIVGKQQEFKSDLTNSIYLMYPTGSVFAYNQPNFIRGDIITLACKEAIPFTFFGIWRFKSNKPPYCEFHSLKKKYGKRYDEKYTYK